ncbi:MAG: acylphosphatase [bacterium]|nr:acylphosphatase [bacterium]MDD5756284.1 acylphosphatase [bacterium]
MVNELKAVHIIVKGTVQGVGFRYYTRQLASTLGLSGFVKNLANGDVEIEAEGSKEGLQSLIHDLRNNKMAEYVADLKIEWSAYQNKYKDFVISL